MADEKIQTPLRQIPLSDDAWERLTLEAALQLREPAAQAQQYLLAALNLWPLKPESKASKEPKKDAPRPPRPTVSHLPTEVTAHGA